MRFTVWSCLQYIQDSLVNQVNSLPKTIKMGLLRSKLDTQKPLENFLTESGLKTQIELLQGNVIKVLEFYNCYYLQARYEFQKPLQIISYSGGKFHQKMLDALEKGQFPPLYIFECNYQHTLVGISYLESKLRNASLDCWAKMKFCGHTAVILQGLADELDYSVRHYVQSAQNVLDYLVMRENRGLNTEDINLKKTYIHYSRKFKRLVFNCKKLLSDLDEKCNPIEFSETFVKFFSSEKERIRNSLEGSIGVLKSIPFFKFLSCAENFDIKAFLIKQEKAENTLRCGTFYYKCDPLSNSDQLLNKINHVRIIRVYNKYWADAPLNLNTKLDPSVKRHIEFYDREFLLRSGYSEY